MKENLKIAGAVIAFVMMCDFAGMLAWSASGQQPADDFFVGTISTHIVRAIIQ